MPTVAHTKADSLAFIILLFLDWFTNTKTHPACRWFAPEGRFFKNDKTDWGENTFLQYALSLIMRFLKI
jgi:hypothetical protein